MCYLIFIQEQRRLFTLILELSTLCTNSLGGWLGTHLPLYDNRMTKYALGFKRRFELNQRSSFLHQEDAPAAFPSFTRFDNAAIVLEHVHCFWSNSVLVTRENLSRLLQTCHPLYCISLFYKKGSTFSSSRVRGFHSYDYLFF